MSRSARSRTSSVGSSSRQPKISTHLEVVGGALVAHRELGEPVDLVAPQVDADGPVGGGGEHVDDRAPHGERAAVLHHLLAVVAGADQRRDQLVAVALLPRPDDDRLHVLHVRPEPLHQRPHRRHQDARASAPATGAATSCAAGGPSSPPTARCARRAASPTPGTCRPPRARGRRAGRWPPGRRRRWWAPPPRSAAGSSGGRGRRW